MGTNISEGLYVTESCSISWGMFREYRPGFRGQRWVREWRSADWGGGEGHRAFGQVGVGPGVNW